MLERLKYIPYTIIKRNSPNDTEYTFRDIKIGVCYMVYDKGKFGVGVSFCSPIDTFDKTEGVFLARGRAFKDLETNPKTMKQLRGKLHKQGYYSKVDVKDQASEILENFGNIRIPNSIKEAYKNLYPYVEERIARILTDTLESMRNALVIEKIKEDTERA